MLRDITDRPRLREIIRSAAAGAGAGSHEYLACISGEGTDSRAIAAYGLIGGTIGSAALYGVTPMDSAYDPRGTELLDFATIHLQKLGALRVIAEFPDSDGYTLYRNALSKNGFDTAGRVEDFYRDGTAMLIFVRCL